MDEGLADEGYDPRLLTRARELAWHEHQPPRADSLLAQNRVMEGVLNGLMDKLDLSAALQNAAFSRKGLSQKHVDEFSIIPLESISGNLQNTHGRVYEWEGKAELDKIPGVYHDIWLDTPTGFAIVHNGIPQAVVGLASFSSDELQIRQMQRIFGRTYIPDDPAKRFTGITQPRGLRRLDWQKLMVGLTAQAAEQLGFSSVGIQASSEIILQPGVHISLEQARKMYNEPAERLGFNLDADYNWHIPTRQVLQSAAAAA